MYVQVQDYCQQTAANTQPALKSGLARLSSLARKPVFAYRPIYSATMPDALHSTLLSSVIQAHAHAHTHCICNGCWFVTALPCSSIKPVSFSFQEPGQGYLRMRFSAGNQAASLFLLLLLFLLMFAVAICVCFVLVLSLYHSLGQSQRLKSSCSL